MSHALVQLALLSFALASGAMVLGWFVARAWNNYSLVDIFWSYLFFVVAAQAALIGSGWAPRRLLMLACVSVWSLRLGTFLGLRIIRKHPVEDGRYVELRAGYGQSAPRGFFWFFQYQAWSIVLLSSPFLLMALNSDPGFHPLELAGAAIFAVAFAGEALADRQASRFKAHPANRSKVCDRGLWGYSRHPNYFFESIIWWGYFVMALGSPGGVWTVYCPLLILFLLLKVTGIPLAEEQALKSRGAAYAEYQRRVSKFIPWPWFPKTLLLAAFLASTPLLAGEARPDRVAEIFPIGETAGEPLFTQRTHYEKEISGETRATTLITDSSGAMVMHEVAHYLGSRMIRQEQDQFQTGEHYEVDVQKGKVVFRSSQLEPGARPKESSVDMTPDFITGPVIESYLDEHWSELSEKKDVSTRFGVLEIRDTVGFDLKARESSSWQGREVTRVAMRPSSFFIRLALSELQLFFDPSVKRLVRFIGRTPLKRLVKGKLESFDAEILYH